MTTNQKAAGSSPAERANEILQTAGFALEVHPFFLAMIAVSSSAAFRGGREDLQRYERTVGITVSAGLLGAALLGARFPRLLAWPLAAASGLVGTAGLLRTLRPADSKERRDAEER